MTQAPRRLGEVTPLVRRLTVAPDPLALFSALTDGGRRPDTLLLESADRPHGERSILVLGCAARMTARGEHVEVTALTASGIDALAFMRARLERYADGDDSDARALRLRISQPAGEKSESARFEAPSPLDALRVMAMGWTLTSRPCALPLLAVGVFAYDLIDGFEALPPAREDALGYPDFVFWLPERMVVIDHRESSTTVVSLAFGGPAGERAHADAVASIEALSRACDEAQGVAPASAPASASAAPAPAVDIDDAAFRQVVSRAREHVVAGDVFQIVASRTFSAPCADPLAAYARLRALNPSPYMFYVRRDEDTLFGASPETCVKVSGGRVEIRPIAGTRPRGRVGGVVDDDLDSRYEAELRTDEKELAEHMMLVDLARNDVARVSEAGTRRVDRLLTVERYSHVMHLVSYVSGRLRAGYDALHAYAASMNMGTLVGAPKVKAATLLRGLEATRRGPYGGAVGYVSCDGEMDSAIIIRSALVRDGVAHVRAGAGIVYDSDPQAEAMETRRKAQAVITALGAAGEAG